MFIRCAVFQIAFAAAALFAQRAQAFIDPPYLSPEHPVAGETVSVSIRSGECDAILTGVVPPRITQNGNAVRILFWSSTDTDPILCNVPIGTGTYSVGSYPPGTYTLQVDREYFGAAGELITETLGVLPFTVAGIATPPVAAPTLGGTAIAWLILGLVGLAALATSRTARPASP